MAEPAPVLVKLAASLGTDLEQADRGEQASLMVPASDIVRLLTTLQGDEGFQVLTDLTAVDWLGTDRPHRFEIVYQLMNVDTGCRIRLKSPVDTTEVHPSIVDVYPAAGFAEREVYDLFGIVFSGNPDNRRLVNPDDFDGHPLRKDFPLRGRGYRDDFPNYERDLVEPN